ncbi:TagK domain-containing protein [Erwinia endophytica]|uniref:TagK domain-containing protein n=1 Tax=Erwinia endophytica TaxID=1563158 RepID=UPI001265D773|nr:TagK domain-containing protein [Erwinia endophytica]KAB8305868.1 TagK domain-containing protein [Erwinia endophytica]
MQLLMTWPDTQCVFHLTDDYTFNNAACFNVKNGTFGPPSPEDKNNVVYFYTAAVGPIIFNDCETFVCLIDGVDIARGQTYALRFGAAIQLGHFTFSVMLSDEPVAHEDMLYSLLNVHSEEEKASVIVPELEDILPNGGHYTGDLRYFNEAMTGSESENDILKKLEVEYKKFLIWGEQNRKFFDENPELNNKLSGSDHYFDVIRDEMKNKTLTECIIEAPSLIDEVWKALNMMDYDDELLGEEAKLDILKSLAPENISSREKAYVPELVFQDLYKTGLDSLY